MGQGGKKEKPNEKKASFISDRFFMKHTKKPEEDTLFLGKWSIKMGIFRSVSPEKLVSK